MTTKLLFKNGKIENKSVTNADIKRLIYDMMLEKGYLQRTQTSDLLDFFEKLSKFWLADKNILLQYPNVKALAQFISRKNFSEVLNVSLRGNLKVLDSFENLPISSSPIRYHCQPRGLVVHWLAGNASLLGFYSIFQALVTKNVSIVKPSSRAYEDFINILATVKKVNTKNVRGMDLMRSIAVVLVGRNDVSCQKELSSNADVRVAWGGKEAIEAISSLPKKIHSEDIMLGPKYSLGIIDKKSLVDYKKIAAKLALDIATFDQYACSSPHTVFVEEGGKISPKEFAKELANSLEYVGKKILKKGAVDVRKNMDILTLRAKYGMVGEVWSSSGTEWTVILSKEAGLSPACASRLIFVKPVKSLRKISSFVDHGNQTIGIALKNSNRLDLLKEITSNGVDRCVPYGRMTFFESPWDGMFITDRLVRWVSYYQN